MIAPLRRRHFHMFVMLAVLLPVAVALAIGARPGDSSRASEAVESESLGQLLVERPDLFSTVDASVRVFDTSNGGRLLAVTPSAAVRTPDTLIYWLSGTPSADAAAADGLPSGARLLGPLRNTAYPLPSEATNGRIILYSLGHQEVLDQGALTIPAGSSVEPPANEDGAPGENPS